MICVPTLQLCGCFYVVVNVVGPWLWKGLLESTGFKDQNFAHSSYAEGLHIFPRLSI